MSASVNLKDQKTHRGAAYCVMELENHHCRWPIGQPSSPNFHFCACPEADFPARHTATPTLEKPSIAPVTSSNPGMPESTDLRSTCVVRAAGPVNFDGSNPL